MHNDLSFSPEGILVAGVVRVVWLGCRLDGVGIAHRGLVDDNWAALDSIFVNNFATIFVSCNLNQVNASTKDAVFTGEVLHEIKLHGPVANVVVGCTIFVSGETSKSTSGGVLEHGNVAFHVLFFKWVEFGIIGVVTVAVGAD